MTTGIVGKQSINMSNDMLKINNESLGASRDKQENEQKELPDSIAAIFSEGIAFESTPSKIGSIDDLKIDLHARKLKNRHKTFPGVGRDLKVEDVGKKVLRVAPLKRGHGGYDFSFLLHSYKINQLLLNIETLRSLSKESGELVLRNKSFSSCQLDQEWNDGNWIPLNEFVKYRALNPKAEPTIVDGYNTVHVRG